MPRFEVCLVRYYTGNDTALVEIEAENKNEAKQIAHDMYENADPAINWEEGDAGDIDDWYIYDIDKVED